MQARYVTENDIMVTVNEGEFWQGNAGPMEITFNTIHDEYMEILVEADITPDPYIVPPPEFPEITRRQIRLWLLSKGISVADVDTAIEELPEPDRSVAKIEWDGSTFLRTNPFVNAIGSKLGFTPQQMDVGWLEAAVL